MGRRIGAQKALGVDAGVFLGRRQAGVAQQLLDGAQVGAAAEQVGGEGMAHGVRRRVLGQPGDAERRRHQLLVAAPEVLLDPDPQALGMWLEVDGRRMQDGSTRTMIFDVRQLVSYVSHFITLHPGDIISTGTPPGVGLGMKPPRYLRPGDEMVLRIDGLGEQRQAVVAFDDWTAKVSSGEPTH